MPTAPPTSVTNPQTVFGAGQVSGGTGDLFVYHVCRQYLLTQRFVCTGSSATLEAPSTWSRADNIG